ncbi:MAG: hypothetical protein ACLQVJ_29365 [Syntrophobacteraceae bacterium]
MFFKAVANGAGNPLPQEIGLVGEKAEDVIDLFVKKDWKGAQAVVDTIVQNGSVIDQDFQKRNFPPSMAFEFDFLLFRLQELTHEKRQPIEAALAANQITVMMNDLEKSYDHSVPLEIGRMDYLGREIILGTQVPNDYGLIPKRISQLEQTWSDLKPSILDRNGKKTADQIDHILSDLKKQPTKPQMVKDGNQILDLVDQLESLFK